MLLWVRLFLVPVFYALPLSFVFMQDGEMDDPDFDKALYDFYVSHVCVLLYLFHFLSHLTSSLFFC